MSDLELKNAIKRAVLGSLSVMERAHPSDKIIGYALCTDDGLSTVFHAANTPQALARASNPSETQFVPVDWPYDEGAELFDDANQILVDGLKQATMPESFEQHVDSSFAQIVAALRELREEGIFGPDVFLWVTSTDPGDRLRTLARDAARVLNSPRQFAEWRSIMD